MSSPSPLRVLSSNQSKAFKRKDSNRQVKNFDVKKRHGEETPDQDFSPSIVSHPHTGNKENVPQSRMRYESSDVKKIEQLSPPVSKQFNDGGGPDISIKATDFESQNIKTPRKNVKELENCARRTQGDHQHLATQIHSPLSLDSGLRLRNSESKTNPAKHHKFARDSSPSPTGVMTMETKDLTATSRMTPAHNARNAFQKATRAFQSLISPRKRIMYRSDGPRLESSIDKEPYNAKYKGPTVMHTKSYRCKSWEDVELLLMDDERMPESLRSDIDGRNPFHLLGINNALQSAQIGSTIDSIANYLLKYDNGSMLISKDNNGNFPFQDIVKSWTIKEVETKGDRDSGDNGSTSSEEDIESSIRPNLSSRLHNTNRREGDYLVAELPNEVAYAMYISSAIIDKIEENSRNREEEREPQYEYQRRLSREQSSSTLHSDTDDLIEKYISEFSAIKDVMKNILYLNEDDRRFVFSFSITKRIMLRSESLGPWLIKLFNDGKCSQERAAEYVCLLSDTLASNDEITSREKNNSAEGIYKKFETLDQLMPSILMLDEGKIEDVASLPLISKGKCNVIYNDIACSYHTKKTVLSHVSFVEVIDRLISTPFVATFLFADIILLSILIFCFRKSVDGYLVGDGKHVRSWLWCANAFGVYFQIREFSKGVALMAMSKNWSKVFWNFSTAVNQLSIFMVILCVLIMRLTVNNDYEGAHSSTRSMFALTTGLLWLRFLGLVKSINIKLATFVLAIVQVSSINAFALSTLK